MLMMILYPQNTEPQILKNGQPNELVQYAYEISGQDMDFVLTVERESGFYPGSVGDNWTSKWLCQWHNQPHVWNDPNFSDPYWQVEKCLWTYSTYMSKNQMYKLSWYKVRHTVADRFTIINT